MSTAGNAWEDIRPGSTVAFEKDGVIFTDVVTSVGYTSPEPAVWPELSRWQRVVRRLTPSRFRKPLLPVRAAELAKYTVFTGEKDAVARAGKTIADIQGMIDGTTTTTEAEANREYLNSGQNDGSGIGSVCDECYEHIMERARADGLL